MSMPRESGGGEGEGGGDPRGHGTEPDPKLLRDLKTLATFIDVYCKHRHEHAEKGPVKLKTYDVEMIAGRPVVLCESCRKLFAHAFVKRSNCPMEPKPACKHCPSHCYHPTYREKIQEVMRFSGRKIMMGGRLDYLYHLLF
jgi:hypothetical protein